jgi:hypothetical protein
VESHVTRSLLLQDQQLITRHLLLPTLLVIFGLKSEVLGEVEFVRQNRVPGRHLIHTRSAVAQPLSSYEDGALYPEREFNHLERGIVAMTHQVPDETTVVIHRLGSSGIRNPGCLNN